MMYWDGDHMSGGGYVLMSLSMLFFWGLLIAGVVAGFRYYSRAQSSSAGIRRPTAEQMLAERYARGEIDEQEYERRAEVLRGSVRSASPS